MFIAAALLSATTMKPATSQACDVIEAAFTAAIGSKNMAHPVGLMPSSPIINGYRTSHLPRCAWKGAPVRMKHGNKPMVVAATWPLISPDSQLALISFDFAPGPSGHGVNCIAKLRRAGWTARCRTGWIA